MEMDDDFVGVKRVGSCIPGQRLCSSEGHISADGTYENEGYIHSSLNGLIYMSRFEDKMVTVEVVCSNDMTERVPKKDDIITGKVTTVEQMTIRCMIICVGEVPLKRHLRGMLRFKDSGLTASNMMNFFRVGDIIIAKVLTRMEGPYYLLTTNADDLGVITAYSEDGVVMHAVNWNEVECPDTGVVQGRKLAKVLSTAISLNCLREDGTIGEVEGSDVKEDTKNKENKNADKKDEGDEDNEDYKDDDSDDKKDEFDGKEDEGGEGGDGGGEGGDGGEGNDSDKSFEEDKESELSQGSSDEEDDDEWLGGEEEVEEIKDYECFITDEEDFNEEEYQKFEEDDEIVVRDSSSDDSMFYSDDETDEEAGDNNDVENKNDTGDNNEIENKNDSGDNNEVENNNDTGDNNEVENNKVENNNNARGNNEVINVDESEDNIQRGIVDNRVIAVIDLAADDDEDINQTENSADKRNAKRRMGSSSESDESSQDDDVQIIKHIIHVKIPRPNPRLQN